MTAFELVESQTRPEPSDPVYCQCPPATTRTVLLDIDEGRVNSISCAACQRSLDFSDGMGGVYANDVPMTMTTTVEKAPADNFSGYEIAAIWHELTPAAEPVEEFAVLVDRLEAINPSPAVLDALLDEAAGGAS